MIPADPTVFWMFLIGFGIVAIRISQRTHRVRRHDVGIAQGTGVTT